eukprot:403349412
MSETNNDYENQSFEAEESNRQPSREQRSRQNRDGTENSQMKQTTSQGQQQFQYNIPQNNISGTNLGASAGVMNQNQNNAGDNLNVANGQIMQMQQQQQEQDYNEDENNIQEDGNNQMDGNLGQNGQPTIQDYLISLNQSRQDYAVNDNYVGAELLLGQIQDIKLDAESRIRQALAQKQEREKAELEMQHAQEFENFTYQWDMEIKNIQELSSIQKEQMRQKHARELEELRMYLEQSISLQFKPSPELLNLRKIQQTLSKQKNYTEAKKVQKVVKELEEKENEKYQAQRSEKISTQLAHMEHKHSLEQEALLKKINTQLKEKDKIRKVQQQEMLQRFLNGKNEQNLMQKLELSKLNNQLKIKGYASTIVGKYTGSFQSISPTKVK